MSVSIDEPLPAELRRAIEDAKFFEMPARNAAPSRGADRLQYSISVSDGAKAHTVSVTDGAVPDSLQPLIDYLSKAAMQGGGSR
jgi:hypothetical protein